MPVNASPGFSVGPTISLTTAEAISEYVRVTINSSGLAAIAGAGDAGIGYAMGYKASGAVLGIRLHSAEGTQPMIAAGAITRGAIVYASASGKCDDAQGGTILGIAAEAASADGNCINVIKTASRADSVFVTYTTGTTAAATDFAFFVATRPMQVLAISQVHGVAAGNTSTLQVTKDTGTDAPGAGSDLLTSTGFNLNATANTVQTGTLTSTAADLLLAAGDRLSVDFANTIQSTAGVVVTVELRPL